MNHHGGMSQLNCDAGNQNEVNHQIIGSLGLLPSASSLTGGDQRFPHSFSGSNHLPYEESSNIVANNDHSAAAFPHESFGALGLSSLSSLTGNVRRFADRLSGSSVFQYQGSNNIAPSNGHSAGVVPHNIGLDAEYAGKICYNNLNMSVGLCLHPYGPETLNTSNSSTTVVDSGISSDIEQERGLDSSAVDKRRLSCKRRSPEHTAREFLIGESSSTGAQAGIFKRQASEANVNNSSFTSYTGPVSHQEQFETRIGHGTMRPVSDMQHLSEARQSESLQSNVQLRPAANQQAFLQPSILSSGNTRDTHVQLPCQPPFFRSAETPVGAISSVQIAEHVPDFLETLLAPPWVDVMNPSFSPSILPVYTAVGSGLVAPFHFPRNISGNVMFGPQIGRGNGLHNAGNLSFVNRTAILRGDFIYPSHYGSIAGIHHPSNAPPTWVPGFNFAERHVLTTSGIVNHSVVASTTFPRQSSQSQSNSDSSAVSQEMDVSIGFGNAISQNQHTSVGRSENQAVRNLDHPYRVIWAPANAQNRMRLRNALRNALAHLHSGGSLRREDFMMLDHSIILRLLEEHSDVDEVHLDVDEMEYEDLVALEEHIGFVNMGLSEEAILSHLRQEKFQPVSEGSLENESCCICQEEYHEDEDLGKLDCGHRFHVDCIKPWLMLKNSCPICKQIALTFTRRDP